MAFIAIVSVQLAAIFALPAFGNPVPTATTPNQVPPGLDATFGTGGAVILNFGPDESYIRGIVKMR